MLHPKLTDLMKTEQISRYSVVVATAKRARQISEVSKNDGIPLKDKAVKIAINDIISKKVKIIEQPLSCLDDSAKIEALARFHIAGLTDVSERNYQDDVKDIDEDYDNDELI